MDPSATGGSGQGCSERGVMWCVERSIGWRQSVREDEMHSGLNPTDAQIRLRLAPIVRLRTLDRRIGNDVLEVGAAHVRVKSDEPLEPGEETERMITFDMIRDFDRKPHRSIRRALARVVGINVPKPDRKSTRLNSSHPSNLVCRLLLEKKNKKKDKT